MTKRKILSNLVLFLFFILVSVAALFSDIFQNPLRNGPQVIEQTKLFATTDLASIKRFTLKNKSGEFTFERNENNQISPWHMTTPRDISANSVFMEKLFNSLMSIKVKKTFPDEQINNSNFSIDKPTSTITLVDPNGKTITIFVGIMNTIDNSTYLKIADRPGIYHVEAPAVSLENATILDLIESQIISIDPATITAFRIYKGRKGGPIVVEFKHQANAWFDQSNAPITSDKVEDYFQELGSLKSSFVVDKATDAQKKQIAQLASRPEYVVSVTDNKENTIDYTISAITKEMSDIDLKGEEYFVVTLSNNSTSYLVKKEFLEIFGRMKK